jgi:hypothetical protein
MSTVIITGSRDWDDYKTLSVALDIEHEKEPITLLVEGGADGADFLSAKWARENNVPCVTVPAEWSLHGKSAGPKRNIEMLNRFPEARVIAFPMPDSIGTLHCMEQARKRKMRVFNYGYQAA